MALKRLGFEDKAALFCELHRWGFEQLTMEMSGTSDVSQHRPIFRHPSGHFAPGTSSQIKMIETPPTLEECSSNPSPSIPIPIASTSNRRRSIRQPQSDDPFMSYRNQHPISESAISSPMIRSPGLSSSTLSDSTRSFSPFSPPPAQFSSPRLEVHPWWTPLGMSVEAPVEKDDVETSAIASLAGLYFESPHHTDPTLSPISAYSPGHSLVVHPDHQLPPCCQEFENGEIAHPSSGMYCNLPAPLPIPHSHSSSFGPPSNLPSATTTPTVSRKTKKLKRSIRPQPPNSNLVQSRSQATSALELISPTAYNSMETPSTFHSRSSHMSRSLSTFHPYPYPSPHPYPHILAGAPSGSRQYHQRPSHEVNLGRSQTSIQRSHFSIRQATQARDLENSYPSPSSEVPAQDNRPFYSKIFQDFSLSSFFPRTQRPESFVRNSPPPPPPPTLSPQASPLLSQDADSVMS
ncbi:hypothetical protein JCM3765_007537 [Sporobolomyces pararoseus]